MTQLEPNIQPTTTASPAGQPNREDPDPARHVARAIFFPGLTRLDLWQDDADEE